MKLRKENTSWGGQAVSNKSVISHSIPGCISAHREPCLRGASCHPIDPRGRVALVASWVASHSSPNEAQGHGPGTITVGEWHPSSPRAGSPSRH